jgi:putative transposase
VRYLRTHYPVSDRRACRAIQLARSVWHYRSVRPDQTALRRRIRDIAETRVRYGYKRVYIMLRRDGVKVNHKRVYRLYSEEGLTLRAKRPRRHVSAAHRHPPRTLPRAPGHTLSMDFVADQLEDGRRFRMLTVVDVFTRECLAIEAGQKLSGEDVVSVLNQLRKQHGTPKRIFCDNGSEFSGRLLDLWAYTHRLQLEFSRPGKPTDNAHIESFNGSFRDECLNVHWFSTLADAKVKIEAWRQHYNTSRPHKSLGYLTPLKFKVKQKD